jgi:hypothetical protein
MTATAEAIRPARRSAFREFLAGVGTIMVKELRSRMRGRRAFIVLTIYLGLLALITYGSYLIVAPTARDNIGGGGFVNQANTSAIVGQTIFTLLSIFQLILICFIAPGFTAGQISLEREKQTLDLLVSTPMRPGAIVLGKLLAALAFVVLMIVAAVPITAIVLMYGGASVEDIARQQLVLLATAVALGAIGLFLLRAPQAHAGGHRPELHHDAGTDGRDGHALHLLDSPDQPGEWLRHRSTPTRTGAAAVRQPGHRDARRRRQHRAGRLRRHQQPAGPASR